MLTVFLEIIRKKDLNWALIVQGFDMDSDGKIDNVDILDEVFLPIP